jgi:hypothetical protein
VEGGFIDAHFVRHVGRVTPGEWLCCVSKVEF